VSSVFISTVRTLDFTTRHVMHAYHLSTREVRWEDHGFEGSSVLSDFESVRPSSRYGSVLYTGGKMHQVKQA
jgi:hypothetical protein